MKNARQRAQGFRLSLISTPENPQFFTDQPFTFIHPRH